LIKTKGLKIQKGINNYGMKLVEAEMGHFPEGERILTGVF